MLYLYYNFVIIITNSILGKELLENGILKSYKQTLHLNIS